MVSLELRRLQIASMEMSLWARLRLESCLKRPTLVHSSWQPSWSMPTSSSLGISERRESDKKKRSEIDGRGKTVKRRT